METKAVTLIIELDTAVLLKSPALAFVMQSQTPQNRASSGPRFE